MTKDLPIPGARLEKTGPGDHLKYVRGRLACCMEMIDGCDGLPDAELKAACWIIGEELTGLLGRIWRASR